MSCVVPGCPNNQKNQKYKPYKVSFCRVPDGLKNSIKKIRYDSLPRKALICEEHFSSKSFKITNGRCIFF